MDLTDGKCLFFFGLSSNGPFFLFLLTNAFTSKVLFPHDLSSRYMYLRPSACRFLSCSVETFSREEVIQFFSRPNLLSGCVRPPPPPPTLFSTLLCQFPGCSVLNSDISSLPPKSFLFLGTLKATVYPLGPPALGLPISLPFQTLRRYLVKRIVSPSFSFSHFNPSFAIFQENPVFRDFATFPFPLFFVFFFFPSGWTI